MSLVSSFVICFQSYIILQLHCRINAPGEQVGVFIQHTKYSTYKIFNIQNIQHAKFQLILVICKVGPSIQQSNGESTAKKYALKVNRFS